MNKELKRLAAKRSYLHRHEVPVSANFDGLDDEEDSPVSFELEFDEPYESTDAYDPADEDDGPEFYVGGRLTIKF